MFFVFVGLLSAQYYVDANGRDEVGCGTTDQPCATISQVFKNTQEIVSITATYNKVNIENQQINTPYIFVPSFPTERTDVSIIGSVFTNNKISGEGALLHVDHPKTPTVIVIDNSQFIKNNFEADGQYQIQVGLSNAESKLSILNSIFNGTRGIGAAVQVLVNGGGDLLIQSTYFQDNRAQGINGAVRAISTDGEDHSFVLVNNTFYDNWGFYAGALVIGYVTLDISQCQFREDHWIQGSPSAHPCHDMVYYVDNKSASYGRKLADNCSHSLNPKIFVWNTDTDTAVESNDLFPENC